MPIRWTPDKDQLLLLMILKVHGNKFTADAKMIAAEWPGEDNADKPTARAITERLVKIRQTAMQNGSGHFAIASAQAKGPKSTPSTPRKKTTTSKPHTPSSKKRKIKEEESDEEDDEEIEDASTPVVKSRASGGKAVSSSSGNFADAEDSPLLHRSTPNTVITPRRGLPTRNNSSPASRPRRSASAHFGAFMDGVQRGQLDTGDEQNGGESQAESDVSDYAPVRAIKYEEE